MLADANDLREEELRNLRLFLKATAILAIAFGVLETASGVLFHSDVMILTGGMTGSLSGIAVFAIRLAERDRHGAASLLVGYWLLAIGAVLGPLFTLIAPLLAILPFVAVALVLPHVNGLPLRVFFACTLATELVIALSAVLFPDRPEGFPSLLKGFFIPVAMLASVTLIFIQLVQFRKRVRRSLDRSKSAIHARDEFISIASHELRTPLTPLALNVDGLVRATRNTPSPSLASLAGKIENVLRQHARLGRLTTELLDISRISSERLSFEPSHMNLVSLTHEVVSDLHASLSRAGCSVQIDAQPSEIWGEWDSHRLEQVLSNLLSNALKFGPQSPIEIALSVVDGLSILKVRDHGIGISPQDQERIFEPFERAVSARHYGGLGLGLWICRTIVESMGGSISVESAPHQGSTFIVQLPLMPPERAKTIPAASPVRQPQPERKRPRMEKRVHAAVRAVENEEREYLQRYIGILLWGLPLLAAGSLIGASFLESSALALLGVMSLLMLGVTALASAKARRGKLVTAALLLAYAHQLVVFVSPFFTTLAPTLVIFALLSLAVALPYAEGRPLKVFYASLIAGELAIAFTNAFLPARPETLPAAIKVVLGMTTMAACAGLVLTVLIQFRSRVRRSLGRLNETIQARDQFISVASRELRTAMVPLSSSVNILRQTAQSSPSTSASALGATLASIDLQLRHLNELVTDLLDISRIPSASGLNVGKPSSQR